MQIFFGVATFEIIFVANPRRASSLGTVRISMFSFYNLLVFFECVFRDNMCLICLFLTRCGFSICVFVVRVVWLRGQPLHAVFFPFLVLDLGFGCWNCPFCAIVDLRRLHLFWLQQRVSWECPWRCPQGYSHYPFLGVSACFLFLIPCLLPMHQTIYCLVIVVGIYPSVATLCRKVNNKLNGVSSFAQRCEKRFKELVTFTPLTHFAAMHHLESITPPEVWSRIKKFFQEDHKTLAARTHNNTALLQPMFEMISDLRDHLVGGKPAPKQIPMAFGWVP